MIGQLVAVSTATEWAPVFYKRLEIARNKALKKFKGNWDAQISITSTMREDIVWWANNIGSVYKSLQPREFTLEIFSDSSSRGWGGESHGLTASGIYAERELTLHINCLELLAAFLNLKTFVKTKGHHVKLYTDNVTTMACINKQGSTKIACNNLTREIFLWCQKTDTKITAIHIAGKLNVIADFMSRRDKSQTEWMLNVDIFRKINALLGPFEIDLFASRINNQLVKYVSWKGDPNAWGTNALTLNWSELNNLYAFPPFSLIQRALQKVDQEKADITMIVPLWRGQPWFSKLLKMLTADPIILPSKIDLLIHPQNQRRTHPLLPKTKLLVCSLSGKDWKVKEFMENQRKSSYPHGDTAQRNSTKRTIKSGFSFVIKNRQITCVPLNKS